MFLFLTIPKDNTINLYNQIYFIFFLILDSEIEN